MPYSKRVIDKEGAIAEAISTELARLSDISHPAHDHPEVNITKYIKDNVENYMVILPAFKMTAMDDTELLTDKMGNIAQTEEFIALSPEDYDEPYEHYDEQFLQSFGATLAFAWYTGQGDLSPTNISISEGQCYPFDFDCCFQNIQSNASFAKSREQQFESDDLDRLHEDTTIFIGAFNNLSRSGNLLMAGKSLSGSLFTGKALSATLNPLLTHDNRVIIQKGFYEQINKLAQIPMQEKAMIINKHCTNEDEKQAYTTFLAGKDTQILHMINRQTQSNTLSFDDTEHENLSIDGVTTDESDSDSELFSLPIDSPSQVAGNKIAAIKTLLIGIKNPIEPGEEIDSALTEKKSTPSISGKI